jgi:lipoic acid synthetase
VSEYLPEWLRPAVPKRPHLISLGEKLAAMGVHTVCQSARCPNLGDCFSRHTATFMILGDRCTRDCRFCAVEHGAPAAPDPDEPRRVAEAARMLGLRHVVITSVTRDDLEDGGAGLFAATIAAVREVLPEASVEVLVPDFCGNPAAVEAVVAARPQVFGHNVETVPRLYPEVRPEADYARSLAVLRLAAERGPELVTKSGLMVGLGEDDEEVMAVLRDLRQANAGAVTIGQYLPPTRHHVPIVEYVAPEVFAGYEREAYAMGFRHVMSAPLVRSSYHAEELVSAGRDGTAAERGTAGTRISADNGAGERG